MAIIIHAKFHFSRLMVTFVFGIWASEPPAPPPPARRATGKPGPDRVKLLIYCRSRASKNHCHQKSVTFQSEISTVP